MDYQKTEQFYKDAGLKYSRPPDYDRILKFDMMCKDPVTKQYYFFVEHEDQFDEAGNYIGAKEVHKQAYDVVYQIKRIFNLADKREYLLTERYRFAGNAYHEKKPLDLSEPERYVESRFNFETVPHPTIEGQTARKRTGQTVTINRYTMPFNEKNLLDLVAMATQDVALYVKEEGRGRPSIQIADFNDFKDKTFDELFYKPHGAAQVTNIPKDSAEARMMSEAAETGKKLESIKTTNLPKIEKPKKNVDNN